MLNFFLLRFFANTSTLQRYFNTMHFLNVISDSGLASLRTYSYKGQDKSISARLFLNSFWVSVSEQMPFWLAPNLITLFGGMCIAMCVVLCFILSPNTTEPLPTWAYGAFVFLLYTYQVRCT